MMKENNRRALALLLLAIVVFTLIFAALFMSLQGNHNCVGEGCSVCLQISTIHDLLSKLGCVLLALFLLFALCGSFESIKSSCAHLIGVATLVSLRVKLSD